MSPRSDYIEEKTGDGIDSIIVIDEKPGLIHNLINSSKI
jgi:hypothetical protein